MANATGGGFVAIAKAGADPDQALIDRLRSGDQAAVTELVARHGDRIYRTLYLIVKDAEEARDLAQDTLLRFLDSLATFRGESSLKAWLTRIATNLALNRLRDQAGPGPMGRPVSLDDDPGHEGASLAHNQTPEDVVIRRLELSEVTAFLDRLSGPLRAVAVLRFHEGLSYDEIALALEVAVGTVRSRLNAVRWQARDLFRRDGSPDPIEGK